jgi:hypothetical protein
MKDTAENELLRIAIKEGIKDIVLDDVMKIYGLSNSQTRARLSHLKFTKKNNKRYYDIKSVLNIFEVNPVSEVLKNSGKKGNEVRYGKIKKQENKMEKELYTAEEIEEICGINASTVHNRAVSGKIQRIKSDGKYKFLLIEVRKMLESDPIRQRNIRKKEELEKALVIPATELTNEIEMVGTDQIGILKDIRELLSCLLEGQRLMVKSKIDERRDIIDIKDAVETLAKAWK